MRSWYNVVFFANTMLQKKATSYQRRAGRLSSQQREQLMSSPFLLEEPKCGLISEITREYKKTCIEIGFGMGDHLIDNFSKHADHIFIGIDLYRAGVARVLSAIEKAQSTNCYVICEDACHVIENITSTSIDRIDIHHPDPWPKKRHHKRRIIHPEFLKEAIRVIKHNGIIEIITDDINYFQDMIELIESQCQQQCRIDISKNLDPKSKYGRKAHQEGRSINAITLIKY